MIDEKSLIGHWIHSHEEDTADTLVYRAEGFAFPPSRGRNALELRSDGSATDKPIAPTDGNASYDGRWELGAGGMLDLKASDGSVLRSLIIKEVHDDRMLVVR